MLEATKLQTIKKQSVLFLCTGNSARSQMAEALLRHKAGELFDVYSAGTQPEEIDLRTLSALKNFGIATESLKSKSLEQFSDIIFDYVITLCDKAASECRSYSNATKQLAWDFPDPKQRKGNNPFTTTLNELSNRLSMFLLVESKKAANSPLINSATISTTDKTESVEISIDPVTFYKTLTDPIRLQTLMLTHYHGELCVCELMEAMDEDSQPKVSRNLAVLKKARVITDRKHGQWVFYRINPELPLWVKSVIAQTTENNIPLISTELQRLDDMQNRPNKDSFCKTN